MQEVLKFINNFNKMSEDLVDVFIGGYCYWFAIILKERFNGEIYYLPIDNHFITKIGDNYYDITGEVEPDERPYSWEEYQIIEPLGTKRIIRDCILKVDF